MQIQSKVASFRPTMMLIIRIVLGSNCGRVEPEGRRVRVLVGVTVHEDRDAVVVRVAHLGGQASVLHDAREGEEETRVRGAAS